MRKKIAPPVEIAPGEYWYQGNIIQGQTHPKLKPFVVFSDKKRKHGDPSPQGFYTFAECVDYCKKNPCLNPDNTPKNYL